MTTTRSGAITVQATAGCKRTAAEALKTTNPPKKAKTSRHLEKEDLQPTTAVPAAAGRKRKAAEAVKTPRPSKKARPTRHPDEAYLQQAIEEFDKQRGYPKKALRREILEISLRFFRHFALPEPKDAHFLDDAEAACRLLASDEPVRLPLFVRDGANWSMIDRHDDRRPIEQIFDFLQDPGEVLEYKDESQRKATKRKVLTVVEVKRRFLHGTPQQPPRYPLNFPDVINPLLDRGMPKFLQNPHCTLLHDIMRRQLSREPRDGDACDVDDSRDEDSVDRMRAKRELALEWMYWQGTVMLAEAGAITYPHWDKYSTSTWISCIEGQIGFGWLAEPSKKEKTAWVDAPDEPLGFWLFRVLRPGETVYMPPGLVHYVFRRPGGGQTMGFAGQMLRRADALEFLKTLRLELGFAVAGELEDTPYAEVAPGLVNGLLYFVNEACREGRFDKFGGRKKIAQMVKEIEGIERLVEKLKRPDASGHG